MLKDILKQKDYLPILKMSDSTAVTKENWEKRKKELFSALYEYSYGFTPDIPVKVWGETTFSDNISYAGKVLNEKVTIHMETERGIFSFPIEIFIPQRFENPPAFLHIAFRGVPDRYIPVEEITDAGYALIVVLYEDMVNDAHFGDFSGGLAEYFGTDNPRKGNEWGKIGMWAYGTSRVMDYLCAERKDIDTSRIAVMGHSRLGKTALWCGAQDERFACVMSNNSGYGGAASSKHGKGERITDFENAGSWDWFCENFRQFHGKKEDEKPYDQSFLLSLIAPRLLCIGSAALDFDADPEAEFLTALHASPVWEMLGEKGLICPDRMPVTGDHFTEGNIGYHLRDGRHFLSREDWGAYIKFLDKKWK